MYPQHLQSGRTDTILRAVGIAIWLIAVAVVVLSLGSWAARGFPPQPASWSQGVVGVAAIALVALVYASVAAALIGRAPRNLIGWVFLAIGVSMALVIPLNNSFEGIFHAVRPVPQGMLLMGWGTGAMLLPGTVLAAIIVLILLPGGRPEAPHWRRTLGIGVAGCLSSRGEHGHAARGIALVSLPAETRSGCQRRCRPSSSSALSSVSSCSWSAWRSRRCGWRSAIGTPMRSSVASCFSSRSAPRP